MGFDWTAFATGFLEQTYDIMEGNRKKAEEYEDKQRELAERNTPLMQQRKEVSNIAYSKSRQLLAKGVPENLIREAHASGPTGLSDLEKSWSDAERKYGPEAVKANPDMYFAGSLSAADLRMEGDEAMPLDQYIQRTYGVAAPSPGSYKEAESNFLSRFYGRNAKDRVRARLDQEIGAMGYSLYDINEIARSAEYTSLAPGAAVQYKAPNVFTPRNIDDEFINLNRIVSNMESSTAYQQAEATLEAAREKASSNIIQSDPEQLKAAKEAVAAAQANLDDIKRKRLGPVLMQKAGIYQGDSYAKVMGSSIDALLGEGFTSSIFGTQEEEAAATTAQGAATPAKPEDITTTKLAPAVKRIQDWQEKTTETFEDPRYGELAVVTEGDETKLVVTKKLVAADGTTIEPGTELPAEIAQRIMRTREAIPTDVVEQGGVSKQRRRGGSVTVTEEEAAVEEGPKRFGRAGFKASAQDTTAEEEALVGVPNPKRKGGRGIAPEPVDQSMEIKQSAEPDKFYAVKIPGVVGEKKVKGSDLSLIPDEMLSDNVQTVAIREMDEGEDLKTWGPGRLKSAFKTGIAAQPVEGRSGPTQRPMVGKNLRMAEANDEANRVDEMSDSLLRNSGLDMLDFAREQGLNKESRNEDILMAITEWAQANKKQLPMDKGALIYAIKYGLGLR